MRAPSVSLALAVVLLGTSPGWAAPGPSVLVDTCGQVVPEKAAAYLAANLDCSAFGGTVAVDLGRKATLDLGGFTFTTGTQYGVACQAGGCTVRNGTVTGAASIGILGTKMRVENVTVTMSGLFATSLAGSVVRGSTITGSATVGIHSSGTKKRVLIVDTTVTGHGRIGVWAFKVELRNSAVTGNGTDPECAASDPHCADLLTDRRPKLKDSTCGRSQTLPENPTPGCLGWCICTDD